ncbi:MAG: DUF3471 domain-containing protein, partial [Burkholderiales bacterium]
VHHGGALDGFRSHLVFLPDDKLGIMVLSNLGRTNFPVALAHELFDRLLELPPAKWSERYLKDENAAKAAEREAERKGYSPRKTGTQPSHPLSDYPGHYQHPGYGTVKIEQHGEQLSLGYGNLDTALKHFHYDAFEFVTNPVAQSKLTLQFETGADGEIVALSSPMEPSVAPIVFQRVADPAMRTRKFLQPLSGTYLLGTAPVEIVLRDDNVLLMVQANGQTFQLEPLRDTRFRVKDRAGWTLEFKQDDGAVNEAVLHQPGSSSILKRRR